MLASATPMIAGLSSITSRAFAAAAQENSDFNFVVFNVEGGMDSLLGLHPWLIANSYAENDLSLNYQPHEVLKNINGTQISLGPSAQSLAPFAKNMAIVRGMYMGGTEVGHPKAIQHMAAGRDQESAPHVTAHFGAHFQDASRFLMTNCPLQLGTVNSFPIIETKSLRNKGDLGSLATTSLLDIYKDKDLAVNSYLNLLNQKNNLSKFQDVISRQKNTGEIYDETIALASLAAGLSRVVQIGFDDTTKSLDTHSFHSVHREYQQYYWVRIAAFLKGLADLQLLEKTLVVVTTEFNRNPGLNGSKGKDHNYYDNAVALFGRNVEGGKVIGDRKLWLPEARIQTSYWSGSYFDYKSGQVTDLDVIQKMQKDESKKVLLPDNVDLIRPMNLWATVAHNLSPELPKTMSFDAPRIPWLLKGS